MSQMIRRIVVAASLTLALLLAVPGAFPRRAGAQAGSGPRPRPGRPGLVLAGEPAGRGRGHGAHRAAEGPSRRRRSRRRRPPSRGR